MCGREAPSVKGNVDFRAGKAARQSGDESRRAAKGKHTQYLTEDDEDEDEDSSHQGPPAAGVDGDMNSHSTNNRPQSDDWTPAIVVDNFTDDNDNDNDNEGTASTQAQHTQDLPDWDPCGDCIYAHLPASNSVAAFSKAATTLGLPWVQLAHNQADDDLFAALERSGGRGGRGSSSRPNVAFNTAGNGRLGDVATDTTPDRPPLPPLTDLRAEQRRIPEIDRKLRQHSIIEAGRSSTNGADDDRFAAFEHGRGSLVANGSASQGTDSGPRPMSIRDNSAKLAPHQLDSMNEASNNLLAPPTQQCTQSVGNKIFRDYFGSSDLTLASRQPRRFNAESSSIAQRQHAAMPQRATTWWGSLRHLGSGLATRAADYFDPGVDFTDEELRMACKMGAIDFNSGNVSPAVTLTADSRSSNPAPGRAPPKLQTARQSTDDPTSASTVATSKLVSGAPGVDFNSLNPHWNPRSWSLPADDPSGSVSISGLRIARTEQEALQALGIARAGAAGETATNALPRHLSPLPVSLVGRSEDTAPVITSFHSSHIQPYLPPRLKLGRTWRLLYSSDQHGVSLENLYDRVRRGMEEKDGGTDEATGFGRRPGGLDELETLQDGWLRGASSATRGALNSNSYRPLSLLSSSRSSGRTSQLGSGITNIADAGLVLAVRDADDNVFGAFTNERLQKGRRGYYGSGEGFLFRQVLSQSSAARRKVALSAKRRHGCSDSNPASTSMLSPFETPYVRVYPSTALNTFHALSEPGYLAFGGSSASYQSEVKSRLERLARRRQHAHGGESGNAGLSMYSLSSTGSSSMKTTYGLWLDERFSQGVTGHCETYANGPLCDSLERVGDVVSIFGKNDRDGSTAHRASARRGEDVESGEEEEEDAETIEVSFEPVVVEVWAVGLD